MARRGWRPVVLVVLALIMVFALTWTSSNDSVATTASTSLATGVGEGVAAITITVTGAPPTYTMHVQSIDMNLVSWWRGWITYATATVTIVDGSGKPVTEASVFGQWSGATGDSDSGLTDANGQVTLQSNGVWRARSGTTFVFTVDSVSKDGVDYTLEGETTDSITLP